MANAPKAARQQDLMAETKRIMERLVNMPHKMHKDEPPHKPLPASKGRTPKAKAK